MSTYDTKDLLLATFLKYNKIKLAKDYDEASKSWIFEDVENCGELALQLKNNEASVDPMTFESCRRNLLSMVKKTR